MGYILTPEMEDLRATVKKFVDEKVKPQVKELDREGKFPLDLYKEAFDMGLHLMEIPEEFGGLGFDYKDCAAIYEELAKGDAGFATTIMANCLALKPVLIAGTPDQIQLFSDIIIPGGFGAFGLTEPSAGSDAGNTKTTAVKDGDEWVINGSKCFITNAEYADVFVIFAMTNKEAGLKGISAFLVEKSRKGITIGKEEDKMGIRLSNTTDVFLDDVRVPADHLLGKEGKGFVIAMQTLDLARPFVGIGSVGIAQRALDESISYAKERVTFGKPIIKNQAIQFMLADMDIKVETARQMCLHALDLATHKLPYSREAAISKCYASDIAMEVTTDAVQIHGGYGYSREYPIEKLMRDAKIFQIFEGTNQVQRIVISGALMR